MPQVRWLLAVVSALGLAGCSDEAGDVDVGVELEGWFHAGREAERQVMRDQVARSNAANPDVRIDLTLIPEGSYNAQVQVAALAGDLPDLLALDGPYLYQYIWQCALRPVGPHLPERAKAGLLPPVRDQGTFRGRLYVVGVFDPGLGLYARRSRLEAVGARIPESPDEAWSAGELGRVLRGWRRRTPTAPCWTCT